MAFTRTSHSRIFDRVVRVDRRFRNRDFVGGSYAEFQPIIPRYHVRLFPDTHRRRERQELGEILSEPQAFKAYGLPAHNGKTIMIGDRFIDQKNNQCYDVVGVWRPRGQAGYSQMNHFELRIIEDCPQALALSLPGGGVSTTPPFLSSPSQAAFILRNFGHNEIFGWESLPYFDGFTYNLQYDDPVHLTELQRIVAAGKRYFRYYAMLYYPFSGTELGGLTPPLATWFNFLRDNVQFSGTASNRRMRVGGQVALFPVIQAPSGQQYELTPWNTVPANQRQDIANTMVSLAVAPAGIPIPCTGIWLDQCWLTIDTFQVDANPFAFSGHGDTKESQPGLTALSFVDAQTNFGNGGTWLDYTNATMDFYTKLDSACAAAGIYTFKNGDHRVQNGQLVPKPWLFENAWNSNIDGPNQPARWAFASSEFLTDSRNIISILCDPVTPNDQVGVPEAINLWATNGGWISFTNQGSQAAMANEALAYAQAAQRLAQMGFPA